MGRMIVETFTAASPKSDYVAPTWLIVLVVIFMLGVAAFIAIRRRR